MNARAVKNRKTMLPVMGIRATFRFFIIGIALVIFAIVAAINYQGITSEERDFAEKAIRSETDYICLHLDMLDVRVEALREYGVAIGQDMEKLAQEYPKAFGYLLDPVGNLLTGYSLDDEGTVVVISDKTVIASDDGRLPVGSNVQEVLGDAFFRAIEESAQSDRMVHIEDAGVLVDASYRGKRDGFLLAQRQSNRIVFIVESSSMVFNNRQAAMIRASIVSLIVLAVVLVLVDLLLGAVVARRIDETNKALERITSGDLGAKVEDKGTLEFRSLSSGINQTVSAMKGWITEAESRMDAELATAKAIQESALPSIFPPFPAIVKFDIYATMNAARQVGGDFFDYFLVGDNCTARAGKLGFVVADVSGKGVPAALFMMKAKTIIREFVESGMELGEAVTDANSKICEGNNEGMFVTAWVGLLDYGTGHVEYVNAGHNPPLLWSRKEGWQWIRQKSGPMLGLFDRPYTSHSVDCLPGDMLLLYTDGVTEASDVNENLYGEQRLFNVAEKGFRLHPRELLESVRDDVNAFAAGAEQSDDITIMALEFGVPPEVTATIEVAAIIDEITRVNDFLHAELDRRLCPRRVQNQLDIVVEELFVNVCSYAYPDASPEAPGFVRIQRTYNANPASITVDIIDEGIEFNPLDKPDAVTPHDIEDVPIGGLGILMVKKLVDDVSYERVDGTNVMTIVKKW